MSKYQTRKYLYIAIIGGIIWLASEQFGVCGFLIDECSAGMFYFVVFISLIPPIITIVSTACFIIFSVINYVKPNSKIKS